MRGCVSHHLSYVAVFVFLPDRIEDYLASGRLRFSVLEFGGLEMRYSIC